MRFDRMSGLDVEQLDELEELISDLLAEPWDRGKGHPRELTLHEALIVASGYARNNIIEEIWAEIFDVNQSTISRYISFLTPLIDKVTAEFRPSAEEAAEATKGAIALVDGTLWPCWSWANGFKLSGNRHQPEDDLGQRREPGGLAVLAGLVAASGALGFSFVAASRAARDEVAVPGDLGGQVGGELVKERRGKSIRSR